MELSISIANLFLLTWAIVATILYFRVKHEEGFFKFKTALLMKALAEGKAKFVQHGDGEFEIIKVEEK